MPCSSHYETHYPLQGGSNSFEGISPLWPSFPGKATKATVFYFTPNSVSALLFSTSEQRMNFSNTLKTKTFLPSKSRFIVDQGHEDQGMRIMTVKISVLHVFTPRFYPYLAMGRCSISQQEALSVSPPLKSELFGLPKVPVLA